MNEEFKILVCEDEGFEVRRIQIILNALKIKLKSNVNLKFKVTSFDETFEEIKKEGYHLLVLDLWDKKTRQNLGSDILLSNNNQKQIPTIIYTGKGDKAELDIEKQQSKYGFLEKKIAKTRNGENLIQFIEDFIYKKITLKEKAYSLYNEDDQLLQTLIERLGANYFNDLMYKIKHHIYIGAREIVVYRMTLGLSGALLFRLEIDGYDTILKVSTQVEKLEKEHDSALIMLMKFPPDLTNYIEPYKIYTHDKKVLGILIKKVENSETLFDYILNESTTMKDMEDLLELLFLDDSEGLKQHYNNYRRGKGDWTNIFDKINKDKLFQVNDSYAQILPVIKKYYREIDPADFNRLTVRHDYGKLNKSIRLDKQYKKNLVLLHGDMHAKNILVRGSKPVLIDSGSVGYQYWCIDLCKLIVYLFTDGLDYNHPESFDIKRIPDYISLLDSVLELKPIEINDQNNEKFFTIINWLTKHAEEICPVKFEKFEFQLGLMREFLQKSYRMATITNSKRAFSLIAAYKCMIEAEKNVPIYN